MIVIPAIDLRGGRVVRLTNGDPSVQTDYGDDPIETARRFRDEGARMLHVVDLDAALGDGSNRRLVRDICREIDIPVQIGGGLRSMESIGGALSSGAARAVLGTAAALDIDLVRQAVRTLGEQIVVALDVKGDRVMIRGWAQDAGSLEEVLGSMSGIEVPRFLVTSIEVDGTLEGPDLALYRRMRELTDRPLIASGGIRSAADLRALADLLLEGAIVGKALYEGAIELGEVKDL